MDGLLITSSPSGLLVIPCVSVPAHTLEISVGSKGNPFRLFQVGDVDYIDYFFLITPTKCANSCDLSIVTFF